MTGKILDGRWQDQKRNRCENGKAIQNVPGAEDQHLCENVIRCRYRKDVGQISFVGKEIFIVALNHQDLCQNRCCDQDYGI